MSTSAPQPGPAPRPPGERPALLGPNRYGKAECRVVRVTRAGATHHIKDLNVSVALSGDLEEAHRSGSNAHVLPTDTAKNTVYAFAREHGIASPEQFGILLARHFVTSQEPLHRARIRVEEYAWERIGTAGAGPPRHSFVRKGQEVRTAQVTFDGARWEVLSGLKDLMVLNSTNSEFRGYARDRYTTLQETGDRILATRVTALWRHHWAGEARAVPSWDPSWTEARSHLLAAFADTYSLSLQQTLFEMGTRVIDKLPGIDEIRFALPNRHHFPADLEPFGLTNDNEVYYVSDRPYGLIEATVLRPGAEAVIPADLTGPL
ncbi:urate oxidase [Streptomyces sp. ACA25]|uniref:factor-independent urate hydroxylase n=1 Tax=Streptomyces sp. ACA25 TaxID=3022596 RepID=UPI00230823E5|nr:urate oxidase [Streptomyces sp. ACA25]MDB1089219.1 urate oxidase [Streptomyces sp. ACA25]